MKKSSAEKDHGRRLEDVFKAGLEKESTPPSRIWENIDRELENQELQQYKRQIFWYRNLAAACLLLLLLSGVLLWQREQMQILPLGQGEIAQQGTKPSTVTDQPLGQPSLSGQNQENAITTPDDSAVFGSFSGKQAKNEAITRATHSGNTSSVANQSESGKRQLDQTSKKKSLLAFQRSEKNPSSEVIATISGEKAINAADVSEGEVTAVATARTIDASNRIGLENEKLAVEETPEATSAKRFTRASLATQLPFEEESLLASKKTPLAIQKPEEALAVKKVLIEEEKKEEANNPEKSSVRGWSLSAAYASQYAQTPINIGQAPTVENARMTMAQQQTYQQYQEAIDEYSKTYSPAYSYSAQVGASYRLSEHWQLESGIQYTQNQSTTSHTYLINGNSAQRNLLTTSNFTGTGSSPKAEPILTAALVPQEGIETAFISADALSAVAAVTPTERYKTQYKYQQIGLPVRVAYRHDFNKMYAFLSGGMSLNVLLQNSITSENNLVEAKQYHFNQDDSPFRDLQWAVVTSIGLGYQLNQRFTLSMAPELTYALSPMIKNTQAQPEPYQLGLNIGGRWRLTK